MIVNERHLWEALHENSADRNTRVVETVVASRSRPIPGAFVLLVALFAGETHDSSLHGYRKINANAEASQYRGHWGKLTT